MDPPQLAQHDNDVTKGGQAKPDFYEGKPEQTERTAKVPLFISLPYEVMSQIALHLPNRHLSRLARVNKIWLEPCRERLLREVYITWRWSKSIFQHSGLLQLVASYTHKIELSTSLTCSVDTWIPTTPPDSTGDERDAKLCEALQTTVLAAVKLQVLVLDLALIPSARTVASGFDLGLLAHTLSLKAHLRTLSLAFPTSRASDQAMLDSDPLHESTIHTLALCRILSCHHWSALRCAILQDVDELGLKSASRADRHPLTALLRQAGSLETVCFHGSQDCLLDAAVLDRLVPIHIKSFEMTKKLDQSSFSSILSVLSARQSLIHLDVCLDPAAWRCEKLPDGSILQLASLVEMIVEFPELIFERFDRDDYDDAYYSNDNYYDDHDSGHSRPRRSWGLGVSDLSDDPPRIPVFPKLLAIALRLQFTLLYFQRVPVGLVRAIVSRLRWWRGYCPRLEKVYLLVQPSDLHFRRGELQDLREDVEMGLQDGYGSLPLVVALENEDDLRFEHSLREVQV